MNVVITSIQFQNIFILPKEILLALSVILNFLLATDSDGHKLFYTYII
jgi:hypothetical protein